MVRGPITASTALCATALPVPNAIPEISVQEISTNIVNVLHWLHLEM